MLFTSSSSHIDTVLQRSAEGEGGGACQFAEGLEDTGGAAQGGAGAAGAQVWHSPWLMCSTLSITYVGYL